MFYSIFCIVLSMKNYKIFLLIIITSVIGAGVGTLSKIGLRDISPIYFTFWRFFVALIVLLPIFLKNQRITLADFKALFWVSLFAAGNIFLFVFGIRATTASSSQIIYSFSPLMVGILSYLLFSERLKKRKFYGIVIGFVGTLVVILYPVFAGTSSINGSVSGNLLVLLAVISHSIYSVLSKKLHRKYHPITLTTYSAIFTFLLSIILLPTDHASFGFHIFSPAAIFSIVYAGAFGTAAYYLAYQYIIKHSTAVSASTVLYLQPIFAFIWAAALLGERLTYGLAIGAILSLIGIFLTTGDRKDTPQVALTLSN